MTLHGEPYNRDRGKDLRFELGDEVVMYKYPHSPYPCNRRGRVTECDHPYYEVELFPPADYPNSYKSVRTITYNLTPYEEST